MLCFTAFRTHPGPEVGAIPAHPGSGLDGPKQTSWPLPKESPEQGNLQSAPGNGESALRNQGALKSALGSAQIERDPASRDHSLEDSLSSQSLVAHDCGYPLSRYTCRATRVAADFLDFIAFCRRSTGVALHPLKILVSHLPPPLYREVSHRNLGLKRCRATRGCRSYSCRCRATLWTKSQSRSLHAANRKLTQSTLKRLSQRDVSETNCVFEGTSLTVVTILFEIITFLIRKPLNHVTVIAENSWEFPGGILSFL